MSDKRHHVIFTGAPRSGKGLMVEIMTKIGIDTGWTIEEAEQRESYLEFTYQGKHKTHKEKDQPYLLKHPEFCETLGYRTEKGNWFVDHVYIFIRPIDDCVSSWIALKQKKCDEGWTWKADGTKQGKPRLVEEKIHRRLGRLVYTLAEGDFPHTFVHFPRYATDFSYFIHTMKDLIALSDLSEREVRDIWHTAIDPDLFIDY
jgi:hypothetical protein